MMEKLKYHKFLIYFGLWAMAAVNSVYAALYYSGIMYHWAREVASSDMIYNIYGKGIKILDMVYATLLIVNAALALISRYRLSRRCTDGGYLVSGILLFQGILPIVYSVSAHFITGITAAFNLKGILTLVLYALVSLVTLMYYKKRRDTFNG